MTARHTPRASGGEPRAAPRAEHTASRDAGAPSGEAGDASDRRGDAPTGDAADAAPERDDAGAAPAHAGDARRAPLAADGTRLEFQDHRLFHELLGHHDEHLKTIERALGVRIGVSGKAVSISGDEPSRELAASVLTQLYGVLERGLPVYASDVDYAVRIVSGDRTANVRDIFLDTIYIAAHRRVITPKSVAQKAYIDAIRKHDIVFAIGPAGTGKCVAGSTLVLTSRGLVPIAKLASGAADDEYRPIDESVASLTGVERASHVYNGGRSRTRRIRTRFGYEIEVTPEHPLLRLPRDGRASWVRADGLVAGDFVALQRGQEVFGSETAIHFEYRRNGRQDHAKAIAVDTLDEELAYVLGILTGDGCLTFRNRVILSSADPEIVDAFTRFGRKLGLHVFRNGRDRPYDYIIASAQLYQLLLNLGMSACGAREKYVPEAILRAPRAIVRAFLRGLFDTDGTVEERRGYPSVSSTSQRLIHEVQLLLLNFGIIASQRVRTTSCRGKACRSAEIEIRGADAQRFFAEIGFGLARKESRAQQAATNTNVDVIPHVAELIDVAVRATTLSRALHKRVYDYRIGRRRPSHAKLTEILGLLAGCAAHDAYRCLELLNDRRLFWAEIVAIDEGEADVYDLTVPGSHSFCAGGFVNHNTYLAMAMGIADLMKQGFTRIILTRPAVEAGEKLGFLPGDLAEKVNPYLRPLYDALHDMVDFDRARKMLERGTIEVAPLAFMRGRTLNDSFVILDEAQNTTPEQMKMFLTRLGYGSKAVITGDVTQIDLPAGKLSGLKEAQHILRDIPGIEFVRFSERDVVRHRLVQDVIAAYERAESGGERSRS